MIVARILTVHIQGENPNVPCKGGPAVVEFVEDPLVAGLVCDEEAREEEEEEAEELMPLMPPHVVPS